MKYMIVATFKFYKYQNQCVNRVKMCGILTALQILSETNLIQNNNTSAMVDVG